MTNIIYNYLTNVRLLRARAVCECCGHGLSCSLSYELNVVGMDYRAVCRMS